MFYTTEVLDRSTGDLKVFPLGEFLTITEFGTVHKLSNRKVRRVLNHLGLLRNEGGRYRLTHGAVKAGLGKRHDKPKSGFPFDVLSPAGARMAEGGLERALAELAAEDQTDTMVEKCAVALAAYKERGLPSKHWDTQMEVCWLADHFPKLTGVQIAAVLDVSKALVSKYLKRRNRTRRPATVPTNTVEKIEGVAMPPLPSIEDMCRRWGVDKWRQAGAT